MSNQINKRPLKGKSLLEFPDDYTVVDIETSGFSPEHCEMIEMSAIRVRKNKIVNEYTTLIKPHEKITGFITSLTGITNEMLERAPMPEAVLPEIVAFLGNDILIGHNVNFDVNFLYDYAEKYTGQPLRNSFVDTKRLSDRLLPELPHHRLKDIACAFSVSYEGAHRALTDCRITKQCYDGLRNIATTNSGNSGAFATPFICCDIADAAFKHPHNVCDLVWDECEEIDVWTEEEREKFIARRLKEAEDQEKRLMEAVRCLYLDIRPAINEVLDKFNMSESHVVAKNIQDGISLRYNIASSGLTTTSSLESKAGTKVITRFKHRKESIYMEIPANRLTYYAKCGTPIVSTRAQRQKGEETGKPMWYRIDVKQDFDLAIIKQSIASDIWDYLMAYPYDFGCCSLNEKCSNAGRCLQPNQDMSASCYYKKNLMRGKNFYAEKTSKITGEMIPPKEGWHIFSNDADRERYFRLWGLPVTAPAIFYNGHYTKETVACEVLGCQGDSWAVIQIEDKLHCIYGEYLVQMQPKRKDMEDITVE